MRHRRPRRPARGGDRHGAGIRPPPARGGGGAERPARRLLRDAQGRLLRLPQHFGTGWTSAKKLASALLEEAGVAVIGGPDFGVHGEGYLRLSYANSAENIRAALERMDGFLRKAPPPEPVPPRLPRPFPRRSACPRLSVSAK